MRHHFPTFLNYFVWLRITDEDSVPEIRILSILLIEFDLKYGVYIFVEVSFYISTTWWVSLLVDQRVPEGTCSQVLRSTSVDSWRLESIKIFRIKVDGNCNFVGLFHHPFWLQLVLGTFETSIFNFFKVLCLAKDHWWGFVPEMRIWSILLIQFDLKRCIRHSRSLFLYFNYLVSVTAGVPESPRGHMKPSSKIDFGWFIAFGEQQNFPY